MPRWALWSHWHKRPSLVIYCLLVEATALSAVVITAVTVPAEPADLAMLAWLAVLGVVQDELSRQTERTRRTVWVAGTPHINAASVFTFAGVLLLPPALVAVLVAVLYTHLAVRAWWGMRKTPPFRVVFNCCLAILTSYSAVAFLAWGGVDGIRGALKLGWTGLGVVAAAAGIHFVVAALIALPGLQPAPANRTLRDLFGSWGDNLFETATLCAGGLIAVPLAIEPIYGVLALPLLVLMHHSVLVRQLQDAVATDGKTGLFNTLAWFALARTALDKARMDERASVGILMIDLDHFKRVNDTYGHIAGDHVIKAVGEVIKACVRGVNDAVGRFGGEEFVVLLPDIPSIDDAGRVAERIRKAIQKLTVPVDYTLAGRPAVITGLSASIGVAVYPDNGTAVDKVLHAADTAVHVAKHCGRNRVYPSVA